MISRTATIQNGHGIHCRPSTVIIKAMSNYDGTIRVVGEQGETGCRSVMERSDQFVLALREYQSELTPDAIGECLRHPQAWYSILVFYFVLFYP